MQGNYTSINWNNSTSFAGYVFEDNIFTLTGEQIGVNLKKYQDVEQALIKCKDRLIELGEIKVPKSPEEIIKEQQEILDKQTQAINLLLEKVNGLEQNHQLPSTRDEGQSKDSTTTSSTNSRPVNNKNRSRRSKNVAQSESASECSESSKELSE